MEIPIELIEQLANGDCVLFVGAEVSIDTSLQRKLPSWSELAQALALHCNYTGLDRSLPRIAQYCELEKGRQELVKFITEKIADPQIGFLVTHKLIAQLPLNIVITTNWDCCLEVAYKNLSRPYDLIVRNEDISYLSPDKVTLVKFHGSIEQPETMIITEDDHNDFLSEFHSFPDVLKAAIATKPLLFLGYNLEDNIFKRFYTEITREVDRQKRRTYVVQSSPSHFVVKWASQKEIKIIDIDTIEFLEALVKKVEEQPVRKVAEMRPHHLIHLITKLPYKALNSFESTDESIFFGRTDEKRRLLSLITSYRLVVLYGESGVGKTSLINAGLEPSLARLGYLVIKVRDYEDTSVAIKREVNRQLPKPIQNSSIILRDFLRHAVNTFTIDGNDAGRRQFDIYSQYEIGLGKFLDRIAQNESSYIEGLTYAHRLIENIKNTREHGDTETLRNERSQIIEQLNWFAKQTLNKTFSEFCNLATSLNQIELDKGQLQGIVIILDQFEEFFIHLNLKSRNEFIKDLVDVYDDRRLIVKFLFSLRDDYFAKLNAFEQQIPEIFRNKFWLERLNREEAVEAITEPVRFLGISYETQLQQQLLNDLLDRGIYPPHLQIVCNRLYDTLNENEKEITIAHYEKLGKAEHILSTHVSSVLAELPDDLVAMGKTTLIGLVTSSNTKAAVNETTLEVLMGGSSNERVIVLSKLVNSRLVQRYQRDESVYYELAHEYLIHEIAKWIDEKVRGIKEVRNLLAREIDNWYQYETLIPRDRLKILNDYREKLELDKHAQELLARSALATNTDPIEWLRLLKNPKVIEGVLLEAVHHNKPRVRLYAVTELKRISTEASYNALVNVALDDSISIIRWTAVEGLTQISPDRASQYFLSIVQKIEGDQTFENAAEAFAVLQEGGVSMRVASLKDFGILLTITFFSVATNVGGRTGPFRQFFIIGVIAGLIGGAIGGVLSSVVSGDIMQPLVFPFIILFRWISKGGIQQFIESLSVWSLYFIEMIKKLVITFISIPYIQSIIAQHNNDQVLRKWLTYTMVFYVVLLITLWSLRKKYSTAKKLSNLLSTPINLLLLPVRIIILIIRYLAKFFKAFANLFNLSKWLTRSQVSQFGIIFLLLTLLFSWWVIGLAIWGVIVGGVFAGGGVGLIRSWGFRDFRRWESLFAPALSYIPILILAIIAIPFEIINAIFTGSMPSGFFSLKLHICYIAKGFAIGLAPVLATSNALRSISTKQAWQIFSWLLGSPDFASKAFQQVPKISLMALLIPLVISVLSSILLMQSLADILSWGSITITIAFAFAITYALPVEMRQEIADRWYSPYDKLMLLK